MKKKLFAVLFLIFALVRLFAYEGVMAGEKNLRIIKSQYFDIIYAPGSVESAGILYEKGDEIFKDVAQKFGLKHEFRLPVVISPTNHDFNAYFSSFPFNHIVIYDSLPDENLVVFTETFINTFRHELIHAITYNLRNDGFFKLDRILGDVYNPALLTITTAWAEGAAVSLESDFGEGRMNSEYAMQIVKQAKIEGVFPKYADIQGARDIYPSTNASYIFGGMFCKWLQEKYGMEKYSEFWYRCVNFKSLTYIGCFKKVYGISIKTAWKEFYDSIEIPENIQIEKKKKNLSMLKSLTAAKNVYAFVDTSKCSVYLKKNDEKKEKIIFKQTNLDKVSLSKDSRFMAVSYFDNSFTNTKKRTYIYDIINKRRFFVHEKSLRDGAIIQHGNEYYLAGVKTESEFSILVVYKLLLDEKKRIIKAKKYFEKSVEYGNQFLSLEGGINGSLYFVYKNGLKYSLCEFNVENKVINQYLLPEEIQAIQKLSSEDEKIFFSFVKKGSMPRLGYFEKGKFYFEKIDRNGGVYNPVCAENQIYYIASYFDGYKLQTLDFEKLEFEEYSSDSVENLNSLKKIAERKELDGSKKFSALKYTFTGPRGVFAPFSLANTYAIKDDAESMQYVQMPVGITYFSSTLWTYPVYYFSAGYGPLSDSYALDAGIFRGGLINNLFSYKGLAHFEFDKDGFKQTYESFTFDVKVPLWGTYYVGLKNFVQFFDGRQSKTSYSSSDINSLFDFIGILSKEKYGENLSIRRVFAEDSASVFFGNIHKAGKGYYNYAGFRIMPIVDFLYCAPEADVDKEYYHFENLTVNVQGKIPGIFPITVEAAIFPSNCCFIFGAANIILFNKEIQKTIPYFPIIYFNRLTFSAQYSGMIKFNNYMKSWPITRFYDYYVEVRDGNSNYYDDFRVKADLYFNPNIGGLTRNEFMLKATFGYVYRFNKEPGENKSDYIIGINFENFF